MNKVEKQKKFRRNSCIVAAIMILIGVAVVYFGKESASNYSGLFVAALGAMLMAQSFFFLRNKSIVLPKRPDEHPILCKMKSDQATCDACAIQYFSNQPDSICDDCKLNPLTGGEKEIKKYVNDCFNHHANLSLEELLEREKKLKLPE